MLGLYGPHDLEASGKTFCEIKILNKHLLIIYAAFIYTLIWDTEQSFFYYDFKALKLELHSKALYFLCSLICFIHLKVFWGKIQIF